MNKKEYSNKKNAIAVIGIAGRFPKSHSLDEFWKNLVNERELTTFFTNEELIKEGVPSEKFNNQNYVKAKALINNPFHFDASFFDINESQAKIMDPQRRILLECAWEALENAGYNPDRYEGKIGVYAGQSISTYLLSHLLPNKELIDKIGYYILMIENEKDFLASTLSYRLNLKGPSMTIQTACSTSLMAVHMACQDLLNYNCDLAIAGGVSLTFPHNTGYLYEKEMIFSPDGHCRAFDLNAQGIIPGEGAGLVVLKRAEEAIEEGDKILAFILGSAANNDGATKVGYTAPSVEGQASVIAEAHAIAEVTAESISYIEAHGTGTKLGDPIEIAALSQTFEKSTAKKNFCALGSLKTNMGHADAAAGILSLIKTILSLQHKTIPASLHFSSPNPKINFSNSPFFVNSKTRKWDSNKIRRAGVSSFGIGGTNVHLVLEEGLLKEPAFIMNQKDLYLLPLSARSTEALQKMRLRLADFLECNNQTFLPDVSYTLAMGRKTFEYRKTFIVSSIEDAISQLRNPHSKTQLENLISNSKIELINMAEEWEKGLVHNLDKLYLPGDYSKISLPTYPFQRKELFIERQKLADKLSKTEVLKQSQISSFLDAKPPNSEADDNTEKKSTFSEKEIELIIEEAWKSFLGISAIDPKADFFDQGYESLIGIKLVNKISNLLNINLSPNILIKYPTYEQFILCIKKQLNETLFFQNEVENLIEKNLSQTDDINLKEEIMKKGLRPRELCEQKEKVEESQLAVEVAIKKKSDIDLIIQLQAGNSNMPPIFLLPGAGGILVFGTSMLQFLNKKIPLYGLEGPGLKIKNKEIKTIEDMASYYLSQIKAIQPEGPYHLVGSSLGGTVAFEIAQRLLKQKEKTNYLVLLDTPTPWQFSPKKSLDNDMIMELFRIYFPKFKKDKLALLQTEDEKKKFILDYCQNNEEFSLNEQQLTHFFQCGKRDMDALLLYIPQYYPGNLTYVLASKRVYPLDLYPTESCLKWWKLRAERFVKKTVLQDHYSMYHKENIKELVHILEEEYFDCNPKKIKNHSNKIIN